MNPPNPPIVPLRGNPYNWQSHKPQVEIPRAEIGRLTEVLRNNGSAVVLGGRGMGKSVFLGQLKAALERHPGTRVVLFETPPAALTVEACLGFLASELGVPANPFSSREVFNDFFARDDAPERLVLLFDEFDRYAEKGGPSDALRLLEAVGVVRLESSAIHDNPVAVYPIASLLNLSRGSAEENDLRADFLRDLTGLLARLHRSSADFFRQGSKQTGEGKRLVPESVFAAHLGLGFALLGWHSEREAQRGAGRTDLLLRRNGGGEVVVAEIKIWGRNDYKEAHRQVESYWTDDVAAGAVVQLTDAELPDWAERYRRECLEPLNVTVEEETPVGGSPIRARFRCSSTTAAGLDVRVDHFLLRLPRRPKPRASLRAPRGASPPP